MFTTWWKSIPSHFKRINSAIEYRKLLLAFIPYLLYLLLFSSYKEFRHITGIDKLSQPHIAILGQIEDHLYFCQPHQLLSKLANPLFDALSAIPYLLHFPLPALFALYLLVNPKRRPAVYPFVWCAGWVNLIAVITQATFPTAPPWYADSAVITKHGMLVYSAPSEAGFHRLDHLLRISLFHNLYSKSPVTFGAFPSLHVAMPTVILLNHPWGGWKVGLTHVIWITLAALYTTHHYLLDALGGIALAVIVRLAILKIWSPFKELVSTDAETSTNGRLLTSYNLPSNNIV